MGMDAPHPHIRRHFVTLGDRQVHYRRAGKGPPAILLHQSPSSSRDNIPLMERLMADFTVIAPDTPGNGLSDPLTLERPLALASTVRKLTVCPSPVVATEPGTDAPPTVTVAGRLPSNPETWATTSVPPSRGPLVGSTEDSVGATKLKPAGTRTPSSFG